MKKGLFVVSQRLISLWLIIIAICVVLSLFAPVRVLAEDVLNIANTYKSADKDIVTSDIVSAKEFGSSDIVRSQKVYDEKMLGVVADKPTVVYRLEGMNTAVVVRGESKVNVTTLNGPIKAGNTITSSLIPGKGQLADITVGNIVGTALENLTDKNSKEITFATKKIRQGTIRIMVDVRPGTSQEVGALTKLIDQLSLLILRSTQTPQGASNFLRYLAAALLAAIIIFLAFNTLGRNVTKGIEAIGRNPLAKNQIQAMIALNIALIAVICIGGIILSFLIIKF